MFVCLFFQCYFLEEGAIIICVKWYISHFKQQFKLGNYSFQIKALDPETNTVQEGYRFKKPISISMFYDVDNLVKANKKVVSSEVEEEDIDPVLYLWDPKNESWWVLFPNVTITVASSPYSTYECSIQSRWENVRLETITVGGREGRQRGRFF